MQVEQVKQVYFTFF